MKSQPDRPLFSHYLVGWRGWSWDDRKHRLTSHMNAVWEPRRRMESKCGHNVSAPAMDCQCGIYALKVQPVYNEYGEVYGKVALWGTVIEHSDGWRAQYAYPLELTITAGRIPSGLQAYGVPIHLKNPDAERKERDDIRQAFIDRMKAQQAERRARQKAILDAAKKQGWCLKCATKHPPEAPCAS